MRAYSPSLQSRLLSVCKSVADAKSLGYSPTLAVLSQAYGEELATGWLKAQLLQVNDFVGAKAKLSDMQLNEVSLQILLEFDYLTTLELILFFARLRSGRYEDFYGSIDPMRILKSLDTFCADRRAELDAEYRRKLAEQRQKDDEEAKKSSIDFSTWYRGLSESGKDDVRNNPYFKELAERLDAEDEREAEKKLQK